MEIEKRFSVNDLVIGCYSGDSVIEITQKSQKYIIISKSEFLEIGQAMGWL